MSLKSRGALTPASSMAAWSLVVHQAHFIFLFQDKSDLASLIQILCIAFGETTPVYSRPALTTAKETQVAGIASPRQHERASPIGNHDLGSPRQQDRQSVVDDKDESDYENVPMPRTYSFKKEKNERVNLPKGEVKSRRAALLLQVDSMLTKARIVFRQAEVIFILLRYHLDIVSFWHYFGMKFCTTK